MLLALGIGMIGVAIYAVSNDLRDGARWARRRASGLRRWIGDQVHGTYGLPHAGRPY